MSSRGRPLGYVGVMIRERPLDVRCTAVGPEDGMWRGVINLHGEDGRFANRLHLSDEEFPTKKKAIDAMSYVVKQAGGGKGRFFE